MKGINPSSPLETSHVAKQRGPSVSFDVRSPVLVEALARATVVAADPHGFLHSEVMLKFLRVFRAGTG